jgi:1-phosphofructokinase
MQVVTITLNPALDLTVTLDNLQLGTVNRALAMQTDPGGKGVNVASFLADAGIEVAVTGFLGEDNPGRFEQLCARKGIIEGFIRVPGETRTGIKIVDQVRQETTDVNLPGIAPPPIAAAVLASRLDTWSGVCPWFIFSGSLPPGLSPDFYAIHIARLKAKGKDVALDTSGEALARGVRAGPTVVKPNLNELQQLVASPLTTSSAVERAAQELLTYGTSLVVVSMGARGALFVDETESVFAVPPRVSGRSSVGAGDAMVAGLVAARLEGLDLAASARLATAYAVGAMTCVGPHLPCYETLQTYREQVALLPPSSMDIRDRDA